MNNRTTPKAVGYEQVTDSRPWYTKSGRLEFYREEDEFIEAGENLPVHREPVDSTFYEPNVIVAPPHEAIAPPGPRLRRRARRPVVRDPLRPQRGQDLGRDEGRRIRWPKDGYRFVFHTPKYRHGAHTTPIDTDMIAVLFGPFGDIYRHDKRSPFVTRATWTSTRRTPRRAGRRGRRLRLDRPDPEDRPFRGWQKNARTTSSPGGCCAAPATIPARRAA
jgi:nitrate reductase / nitrite oxidoreductase, alpha subunit